MTEDLGYDPAEHLTDAHAEAAGTVSQMLDTYDYQHGQRRNDENYENVLAIVIEDPEKLELVRYALQRGVAKAEEIRSMEAEYAGTHSSLRGGTL